MRCQFKPKRRTGERCHRETNSVDGLCHVHKKTEVRAQQGRVSHAPKAPRSKTACLICAESTEVPRLINGLCYKCRVATKDSKPQPPKVPEHALCSVAGCNSRREYWRTCFEHAVRFDNPTLYRRPRAEDYMYRSHDPREGVSDGH